MTTEQLAQIKTLHAQGMTTYQISKTMGIPPGVTKYHINKERGVMFANAKKVAPIPPKTIMGMTEKEMLNEIGHLKQKNQLLMEVIQSL